MTGPVIVIRGAGDLATGVATALHRAGYGRLLMLERSQPMAVRRRVAFSEAVHDGEARVEGVRAVCVESVNAAFAAWQNGDIPVQIDPEMATLSEMDVDVLVDALLAKRNTGVRRGMAPLVIGLGPGFKAGDDVDAVIETHRGHGLGTVIDKGPAAQNTGIPGEVGGKTVERLLRAPCAGTWVARMEIGELAKQGDVAGHVDGQPVQAGTSGVVRGLLRSSTAVSENGKLGDVDPRGEAWRVEKISSKALAVGAGTLRVVKAWMADRTS